MNGGGYGIATVTKPDIHGNATSARVAGRFYITCWRHDVSVAADLCEQSVVKVSLLRRAIFRNTLVLDLFFRGKAAGQCRKDAQNIRLAEKAGEDCSGVEDVGFMRFLGHGGAMASTSMRKGFTGAFRAFGGASDFMARKTGRESGGRSFNGAFWSDRDLLFWRFFE